MKIIFLDIDGVLNTLLTGDYLADGFQFDHTNWGGQQCLALRKIIDQTNAKVVISSTWRKHIDLGFHETERWNHEFASAGIPAVCIGVTGNARNNFRGREVRDWLSEHPEVTEYVILDDESDFYPDQPRVRVNSETGLSDRDMAFAVALLSGEPHTPLWCKTELNPPVD